MPRLPNQVVSGGPTQEDSIRPLLFPGYPATWLPIKWSSVWCRLCAPPSAPSQRPWQPGTASLTPPPTTTTSEGSRHYTMPQKGSNYRIDGRLLHKHRAGFKQSAAGLSYNQTTKEPRVDLVPNRHIWTSEAAKRIRILTGGWGVLNDQEEERVHTC